MLTPSSRIQPLAVRMAEMASRGAGVAVESLAVRRPHPTRAIGKSDDHVRPNVEITWPREQVAVRYARYDDAGRGHKSAAASRSRCHGPRLRPAARHSGAGKDRVCVRSALYP